MNTSATGGYIKERSVTADRITLENAIHDMVVGLTDLDPVLVRPAFQQSPLAEPSPDTDWCAFYIRDETATNYPDARHISDGDGHDKVTDCVNKEIRLYFYGAHAEEYAGMIRRGLHIEQNHYELRRAGIAVRRVGNAAQMPELVNGKWLFRTDIVIYATFESSGKYDIFNLRQSGGPIISDEFRGGKQFGSDFDTDRRRHES